MYKLMWYDYNCSPVCDGLASFFVEDLDRLEREWNSFRKEDLALDFSHSVAEVKEKLAWAKAGEHFTDWYSSYEETPELEFLQEDPEAGVLEERSWNLSDSKAVLYNAFGFPSAIRFQQARITVRSLCFKGQFYLTANYLLEGVACEVFLSDESTNGCWMRCTPYGNPVLKTEYYSETRRGVYQDFQKDRLWTICDVTVGESDTPISIPEELSEDWIARIMADIPGEGG